MQGGSSEKAPERISKRFDAQKTSNPFSDKKPHKTTFGKLYADGKIPCRIQHTTSKMYLTWDINLEEIPYDHLLVECFEGLRETEHPFVFLSRHMVSDMLANCKPKVQPLLPKIINSIRLTIRSTNAEILNGVLDSLLALSNCVKEDLNTFLPVLLVPLNKMFMDKKYKDKIQFLLQSFEKNSSDPIAPILKSKCPTYCPVK